MVKAEKIIISLSYMVRSKIRYKKYKNNEIKEIIEYMLAKIILNIICLTSIVILKNLLNIDNSIYAFLVSYSLLRSRFGGAHLKSERMCLIASVITPIVIFIAIGDIYISKKLMLLMYLFITIIFLKNKTVDSENKLLTKEQKERFAKQGFVILAVVFVVNCLLANTVYMNGIVLGALCAAIVNLVGGFKRKA